MREVVVGVVAAIIDLQGGSCYRRSAFSLAELCVDLQAFKGQGAPGGQKQTHMFQVGITADFAPRMDQSLPNK